MEVSGWGCVLQGVPGRSQPGGSSGAAPMQVDYQAAISASEPLPSQVPWPRQLVAVSGTPRADTKMLCLCICDNSSMS